MKIKDILIEDNEWWLNTVVKSPTPDPRFGPNAGADEYTDEYNILINGKLWARKGIPVVFTSAESADNAVRSISTKFGKMAQKVPAK